MTTKPSNDMASAPGRKRISLFVHNFSATGVVRNAVAIANACAAAGLDVELVAVDASGPFRDEVRDDVTIVSLLSKAWARRIKGRPLQLTAGIVPFVRYLRRRRPDVLLSTGNHAHLIAIIAHRASGRQGAFVCRFSNDVERPRTISGRVVQFLGIRLLRLVARHADRIIAVSDELAGRFFRYAPASVPKVAVIRNGVDLSAVREKAGEPLDHPWFRDRTIPVLIGMGRLKAQKNFERLIRAVAEVNHSHPARLVILGDGSASAQRRLQALAEREGLADRFQLAGHDANPFRLPRPGVSIRAAVAVGRRQQCAD